MPAHPSTRPASVARLLRGLWHAWPTLVTPLLFLIAVLAPPINHDVAAVLSFAERWLAGERLYIDLIDVNPPLIFVLNLIPASIAAATGIDPVAALQFCLVALGLAIWRFTLLVRDRAVEGPIETLLLDGLPGLVVFGAGYDFGQRETLMAAMALPYLLVAARRSDGDQPRGKVGAALLAAIGFALKPHFLAIPALVELAVLHAQWRGRGGAGLRAWLADPVIWAMAGLWGVYGAAIPIVFPEYLGVVVPLVWDLYVDTGGLSPLDVLLVPRMGKVVLLLLPLVVIALWVSSLPRSAGRRAALPRVLAIAGLGALASALAQHKGWSYHVNPIELFAGALACVLAAIWLDRHGVGRLRRTRRRTAAGLLALFALYLVSEGEAPWNQLAWQRSDAFYLTRLLNAEAAGERVLVLSPGIAPTYPALNYARARMTLRTMNIWMLEGAYRSCVADGKRYHDVWEMDRPEFFVYRSVAEDFARAPPAAVVVDRVTGIARCDGVDFDLIAYFSRHPLFAEVWSHYVFSGAWGRYSVYARAR